MRIRSKKGGKIKNAEKYYRSKKKCYGNFLFSPETTRVRGGGREKTLEILVNVFFLFENQGFSTITKHYCFILGVFVGGGMVFASYILFVYI